MTLRWVAARPTRRAAAVVALVALITVALPVGVVVPLLASGVVAGLVLVDLVIAGRARPTGTSSDVGTVALGVPVAFDVHASAGPALRPERLRQPVPPELAVAPDEQRGATVTGVLTGRHRGVHELPGAVARLAGPLGLASCDHVVTASHTVTVFPDLPKARRLTAARRRGRARDEGRVRSSLGLGTEFEAIREYSPDDDARHINWVATSRMGRPMSNQFRVDENRDVLCVVDAGRLMASPVGDLTRLDVALDAATTLAVAAEDAGDRVGGMAFAASVTRRVAPRRRGAEAMVRGLFDVEPVEVESDYERAFVAVGRHRRALVALFTDLIDDTVARSLLAAIPMLSRHHTVLVASCRDPDLHAALTVEPADVRDVVRASVALDLLRNQAAVVTRLRSFGTIVVTAPPDRLGSRCVQAYLRMKQRAVV